jgi:hypothetical protein
MGALMAGDPTRTLLVVSVRPHPWAMLRDLLDPAMVRVAWQRPGDSRSLGTPWAVAGEGRLVPGGHGRLALTWWVGELPEGPSPVRRCASWREVAAAAERALSSQVGGMRLAPTCGLLLRDGRYLHAAGGLESLLAAHPEGLDLTPGSMPLVRRLRALVRRRQLPLELVSEGSLLRLRELEASVAGTT